MTTDKQDLNPLMTEAMQSLLTKNGVDQPDIAAIDAAPQEAQSQLLTQLVGKVYESAPMELRRQLLERLTRHLGLLSLLSIAGGVFAKIRLRGNWQKLPLGLEDISKIQASDVTALVDRVQQVSTEALNGLAQILVNSPAIAGSAAAATLLAVLMHRIQNQRRRSADSWDFYA